MKDLYNELSTSLEAYWNDSENMEKMNHFYECFEKLKEGLGLRGKYPGTVLKILKKIDPELSERLNLFLGTKFQGSRVYTGRKVFLALASGMHLTKEYWNKDQYIWMDESGYIRDNTFLGYDIHTRCNANVFNSWEYIEYKGPVKFGVQR